MSHSRNPEKTHLYDAIIVKDDRQDQAGHHQEQVLECVRLPVISDPNDLVLAHQVDDRESGAQKHHLHQRVVPTGKQGGR